MTRDLRVYNQSFSITGSMGIGNGTDKGSSDERERGLRVCEQGFGITGGRVLVNDKNKG